MTTAVETSHEIKSDSHTKILEAIAHLSSPAAQRIAPNDNVLLYLPSSNTKLLIMKPNSTISLGKFGSFQANDLIGQYYGLTFEIYDRGKLKRYEGQDIMDAFEIVSDEKATNQEIVDRGFDSQKLSMEEIESLKKDKSDGKEIIQSLVQNNTSFDQKTDFSKIKYIKRKAKKFMRTFKVVNPTARTLCDHFSDRSAQKIREMRVDTLSQMMTAGNVRAGAKYLAVDDIGGLLTAAVLEKTRGLGIITVLEASASPQLDIPKYLNFPECVFQSIDLLPWMRIEPQPDENVDVETLSQDTSEEGERKLKRLLRRKDHWHRIRTTFNQGRYDGLLVASTFDPVELLKALTPKLETSRPVVIYSRFKESLHEAFTYLRTSPHYVNSQITESWLREYQVPTGKGGMHPHMMTSGTGGYLLTATTVVPEAADLVLSKKNHHTASNHHNEGTESAKRPKIDNENDITENGQAQR